MPFTVRKVKGGYKVYSNGRAHSRRPMSRAKAEAQRRAIARSYYGARRSGR